MNTLNFQIDTEKCIHCRKCVADCPARIIRDTEMVPAIPAELENQCLRCQHCLAVCPTGAISIFGLKPENSRLLTADSLPSFEAMELFLQGRRSIRQYRQENVDPALLAELLRTVANAPTGRNACELTFTLISEIELMNELRARVISTIETECRREDEGFAGFLAQCAEAYRQDHVDILFRTAPHLLVVSHGEHAACPQEDVVIALSYFELLAQSAGLGTTWFGFLKPLTATLPVIASWLSLEPGRYFYGMLFGPAAIQYARTVQRDDSAAIRTLTSI